MGCNSGRVETVATKMGAAADNAIAKAEAMVKAQAATHMADFEAKVAASIKAGKLTDNRTIKEGEETKTEYTSEFSLDKIASIITSALTAASKIAASIATSPGKPPVTIALSPDAVEAYTDVVNSVCEAAKSNSTGAASLAYNMNRVGLGAYAFMYAVSTNIDDEGVFGTESVSTTAVYFRVIQSTGDIQNEAAFQAAKINYQAYLKMVQLQADLVDRLGDGKIDIDTWQTLDDKYTAAVDKLKKRLQDTDFNPDKVLAKSARFMALPPSASSTLVNMGIAKLEKQGTHDHVVKLSNERLADGYFHQ